MLGTYKKRKKKRKFKGCKNNLYVVLNFVKLSLPPKAFAQRRKPEEVIIEGCAYIYIYI